MLSFSSFFSVHRLEIKSLSCLVLLRLVDFFGDHKIQSQQSCANRAIDNLSFTQCILSFSIEKWNTDSVEEFLLERLR